MAATVTDKLLDAAGTAKAGLLVYVYPELNTVRIKDSGGTFRPIIPNSALPAGKQYGFVSGASAADGGYSVALPDSSQQLPATAKWNIELPDGKIVQGVPPAAAVYTIHDLLNSHGWVYVSGQVQTASTDGVKAAGEVSLDNVDNHTVLFTKQMNSSSYTIDVSFQTDQTVGGSGGAPGWSWTDRTQSGFKILLSSAYKGILTWRAEVE